MKMKPLPTRVNTVYSDRPMSNCEGTFFWLRVANKTVNNFLPVFLGKKAHGQISLLLDKAVHRWSKEMY